MYFISHICRVLQRSQQNRACTEHAVFKQSVLQETEVRKPALQSKLSNIYQSADGFGAYVW